MEVFEDFINKLEQTLNLYLSKQEVFNINMVKLLAVFEVGDIKLFLVSHQFCVMAALRRMLKF